MYQILYPNNGEYTFFFSMYRTVPKINHILGTNKILVSSTADSLQCNKTTKIKNEIFKKFLI